MKVRTIYFTGDPGVKTAVPVYVVSDARGDGVVLAHEVKTAQGADILAYRVQTRDKAKMIVCVTSSAH